MGAGMQVFQKCLHQENCTITMAEFLGHNHFQGQIKALHESEQCLPIGLMLPNVK